MADTRDRCVGEKAEGEKDGEAPGSPPAGAPTAGASTLGDVHTGFLGMEIAKNSVCQKITSPLLGPENLTELMCSLC